MVGKGFKLIMSQYKHLVDKSTDILAAMEKRESLELDLSHEMSVH
jgi:hypothetical protein